MNQTNFKLIAVPVLTLISVLTGTAQPLTTPLTTHPRLLVTAADLPRLQGWANASNPVYQRGLAILAADAKNDMDQGRIPAMDTGNYAYDEYPTEMFAELFAFMSLVSSDQTVRDDYGRRARTLLMYVINQASTGVADGKPFRQYEFSTNDRSRWWGESFALTTDWIYPYLSSTDKATIRSVFLRWVAENLVAQTTDGDHPKPVGVVNDPKLLADRGQVRWAANNYYMAHMRNIGLMAMALDDTDDRDGSLRNSLNNATGAWLYIADNLLRTDAAGGLGPEGFEYSPQSLGYMAQFLLALKTAGRDDPAVLGPQVLLAGNQFWKDVVPAFLHSLSPATAYDSYSGTDQYQPAWYGDSQEYRVPDPISLLGTLGVYHQLAGNADQLNNMRWVETNIPAGGPQALPDRARDGNFNLNAILYFMLFDPAASTPTDPRPGLPLAHFASGLGRILARTAWTPDASWFTYKLSWIHIDHQLQDANQFELYRKGEWLIKEHSGYDLDYGATLHHNTLALQNDAPYHNDDGDYRNIFWRLGSQWGYVSSGDPVMVARSITPQFVYVTGDVTQLYNSEYEGSTAITHASRSIMWIQPDTIVVYDRASSKVAGKFKRFYLNLPASATAVSQGATMLSALGQQLSIKTLLPANAIVTVERADAITGDSADNDPIQYRFKAEAPGGPSDVRFLHVLQGADDGAQADAVELIQSTSGTRFEGAAAGQTVTMFAVDLTATFAGASYSAPATATIHRITGLAPNTGFTVKRTQVGARTVVDVVPGGSQMSDDGGVLELR